MFQAPETLVRVDGVSGELAVRRRTGTDGEVYELIVNGTFLMDTAETSTERLLAGALLSRHAAPERALVAGLGFGVTVDELLSDPRVRHIDVVEIEPALVRLLRDGIVPGLDATIADARVDVVVDDIRRMLPACTPASYDGILLDVDNGPGFLVHEANAEVYQPALLTTAARALRPRGLLAVWSAAPSPALSAVLDETVGPVEEIVRTVDREGRDVAYHIYVATRRS